VKRASREREAVVVVDCTLILFRGKAISLTKGRSKRRATLPLAVFSDFNSGWEYLPDSAAYGPAPFDTKRKQPT